MVDPSAVRVVWQVPDVPEAELRHVCEVVQAMSGIALPASKHTMVKARLMKRLRALQLASVGDYLAHLRSPAGLDELTELVDVMTTNTTQFFREPHHFTYLAQTVIPALRRQRRADMVNRLCCWSAGCSGGHEPYSLAMVLDDCLSGTAWDYSVLGTDLCTRVLDRAARAIYPREEVEPHVPALVRQRHFMAGVGPQQGNYRVVPEIRERVSLRHHNLLAVEYPPAEQWDIIFCRNVLIYFGGAIRNHILRRFCSLLAPGGYLFVGHAETLQGLGLPLMPVIPTVYRRPMDSESTNETNHAQTPLRAGSR